VSNPRDEIDTWLDADVEPLAPPPGSFERISRRARRRKAGRAIASAAAAVVVIAAVVAVPRVVTTLRQGATSPVGRSVAAGGPSPSAGPTVRRSRGGGKPASHSATPVATPGSALSPTTSGAPVPAHFRPTSITRIGGGVGAVIGQAGVPGSCPVNPDDCTSIAGTSNYGRSWYGISAPATGAPAGSTGVTQLR
jgi:hypothetical protein